VNKALRDKFPAVIDIIYIDKNNERVRVGENKKFT
jgi:hypothetical protein